VGDFNGDGVLDVAVANANSNDVSVLLGQENGSFTVPPWWKIVTPVARCRSPIVWFYFGLSINGIQEVTGSIPVSSTPARWGGSFKE